MLPGSSCLSVRSFGRTIYVPCNTNDMTDFIKQPALTVGIEFEFLCECNADILRKIGMGDPEVLAKLRKDSGTQELSKRSRKIEKLLDLAAGIDLTPPPDADVTFVWRLIESRLQAAGLQAVYHAKADHRHDYSKWTVTYDNTIELKSKDGRRVFQSRRDKEGGSWITAKVELVTPILHLDPAEDWMSDVDAVLGTVKDEQYLRAWVNDSCGLHVHVARADGQPFSFLMIQNLVVLWGLYEGPIRAIFLNAERLDRYARRLRQHRRTNAIDSKDKGSSRDTDRVKKKPKKEKRSDSKPRKPRRRALDLRDNSEWTKAVFACQDIEELLALTGREKRIAINLMNHRAERIKSGYKVTLEFREHPGTLSQNDVRLWTLFVAGMCRWTDGLANQRLTVTAVGELQISDLFGVIGLPAADVRHFEEKIREASLARTV